MSKKYLSIQTFFIFIVFSSISFGHVDWSVNTVDIEQLKKAKFIEHSRDGYLAMNLNFAVIEPFYKLADDNSYQPLKSRKEAHITVLTPPEYQLMKKIISMDEINHLAHQMKIQESDLKIICLGRGRIVQDSKQLDTYFLVVQSEQLIKIRQAIADELEKRNYHDFQAKEFYPHITVGFTERDLHLQDGIIKDQRSCIPTLHISAIESTHKKLKFLPNAHLIDQNKSGEIIRGNAPLNYKNLSKMKKFGIQEYIIFKNDKLGEIKSEVQELKSIGYKDEQINNVVFDWKDNSDFNSGCKKIISTAFKMNQQMLEQKKIYLHCTTGEDRTGVLAGSYQAIFYPNRSNQDIFKNELCARGFEAGDKTKEKEVVEKIRNGLTKSFAKVLFRIREYQKNGKKIDLSLCESDPESLPEYQAYFKQENFICE